MKTSFPGSFKIFIAILVTTIIIFILATVLSYYHADVKYAMILAAVQFIALAFTIVGCFVGIKYKTELRTARILNRIGVIGNIAIFVFTIVLMAYATTLRP